MDIATSENGPVVERVTFWPESTGETVVQFASESHLNLSGALSRLIAKGLEVVAQPHVAAEQGFEFEDKVRLFDSPPDKVGIPTVVPLLIGAGVVQYSRSHNKTINDAVVDLTVRGLHDLGLENTIPRQVPPSPGLAR
jgi:hypothetical protein